MADLSVKRSGKVSIFRALSVVFAVVLSISIWSANQARAEQPAKFMQRVANELIRATRSGSSIAIGKVFANYADVYSIGLSALGRYATRLKLKDRKAYHRGLTRYVARYAADNAPMYPVVRAVMTGQSKGAHNVFYVDSRVILKGGQTYNVRWVLFKRGKRYKVRDAEVQGLISMRASPLLDAQFQKYIGDNGGNPRALVAALNK